MQGRKSNQKSRNSTAKKSEFTKKVVNQKDKIVNVIKNSTLMTSYSTKTRTSSKTKLPLTEKKNPKNTYKAESYRNRSNKAISSVSKTVQVRNEKTKLMEFPFDAIKFKEKTNVTAIQSKTHDGFYIQYDEPEEAEIDLSLLNNSKKIIGSYNQRVGRYNELKSKLKAEFSSEIKNLQFKQALIRLFNFLDPLSNMVISHDEIDYRKLPQGVLYFLGGLFHRIREKNMTLSQQEFLEECVILYKRSTNEDVKWFIDEVNSLPSISQKNSMKKIEPKNISNIEFGIVNKESFKKVKFEEQKSIPETKPLDFYGTGYNNVSFNEYELGKSFKNEPIENGYQSKESNPSEKESVKSAHFGQLEQRFSFSNYNDKDFSLNLHDENQNEKKLSVLDKNKVQKESQTNLHSEKNQLKELVNPLEKSQRNELPKNEEKDSSTIRTLGIKRNIADKAEDIRMQIYAKMDQMKLYPENKENLLLKENFTSQSKESINPSISNTKPIFQNYVHLDMSETIKNNEKRINEFFIPKNQKESKENLSNHPEMIREKMEISQKSVPREPLSEKNTGWVNKVTNCEQAFEQLQKMREEFKINKKIIEKREQSRENYIKENPKKTNPLIEDFILEDETRVLKLTEKRKLLDNFPEKESAKYERNIDRLAILSNSRDRKMKNININESLANSCRKSVEVSLPLRYEGLNRMSLSDKKSIRNDKFDKIEELSQKLEKYLKTNAQKIEYSKNFTENSFELLSHERGEKHNKPVEVGYNKILAM